MSVLPSDDEILSISSQINNHVHSSYFIKGCKWMKEHAEIEINKLRTEADEYRIKYEALSSRLKHDLSKGLLVETASTGVINNTKYMEYNEYQDYIKRQELESDNKS